MNSLNELTFIWSFATTWRQLCEIFSKIADISLPGNNSMHSLMLTSFCPRSRRRKDLETFQRLRSFTLTFPKDNGFSSLMRRLRMLTFLVFSISTVNICLGSLPSLMKQLSERICVGRVETFGVPSWCIRYGLKKQIFTMYQAPLQWYEGIIIHDIVKDRE